MGEGFYQSVEMQSVYSTAPDEWASYGNKTFKYNELFHLLL